jgi:hypothetical protein
MKDPSQGIANVPLTLVREEFDPQILTGGGFRVLEEVLRGKELQATERNPSWMAFCLRI